MAMMMTAPRSSMMASAVRKIFQRGRHAAADSDRTPSGEGDVGRGRDRPAGQGWPVVAACGRRRSEPEPACRRAAAMPGRTRRGQVDSWPSSISRLISSPTSRKNTAISASLIQCRMLDRADDRHGRTREIGFGERRIGDDQRKRRRHHQDDAAGRLTVEKLAEDGNRPLFQILHVASVKPPCLLAGNPVTQ